MWEKVEDCTYRMEVFGGWVVHHYLVDIGPAIDSTGALIAESMVFVPDPQHEWKIDSI